MVSSEKRGKSGLGTMPAEWRQRRQAAGLKAGLQGPRQRVSGPQARAPVLKLLPNGPRRLKSPMFYQWYEGSRVGQVGAGYTRHRYPPGTHPPAHHVRERARSSCTEGASRRHPRGAAYREFGENRP